MNLGIDTNNPNTFVLIKHDDVFLQSSAALEIARDLIGAWPLLYALRIIPSVVRDSVYGLIARNRYKLMGKREVCLIPTEELKARFID